MKILSIHWEDSRGGGHWFHEDEYEPVVSECHSVGHLIHEDEKSMTITSTLTLDEDDRQIMAPLTIPKSCIKETTTIE